MGAKTICLVTKRAPDPHVIGAMYVKTNESCTRGILRMSNIVQMPGGVEIQEFTEVDDRKWYLTEWVLDDEQRYRRLVCTQVEEL